MSVLEPGEKRTTECPGCGTEFRGIRHHWARGSCDFPTFTDRQLELIKGLTMGDGCIKESAKNCHFVVISTTLPFLEWLDNQFGLLSKGVRLHMDGESLASADNREGWKDCEYKDAYVLRLRAHPTLTELREKWYPGDDGARYPDDLELTPVALKMWYVSDGGLNWNPSGNPYVTIGCRNELDRPDFIKSLFADIGFDARCSSDTIRILGLERDQFFEYIGEPIPGFEYKWSIYSKDMYDYLKP